jgi:hypothetical protein
MKTRLAAPQQASAQAGAACKIPLQASLQAPWP